MYGILLAVRSGDRSVGAAHRTAADGFDEQLSLKSELFRTADESTLRLEGGQQVGLCKVIGQKGGVTVRAWVEEPSADSAHPIGAQHPHPNQPGEQTFGVGGEGGGDGSHDR